MKLLDEVTLGFESILLEDLILKTILAICLVHLLIVLESQLDYSFTD